MCMGKNISKGWYIINLFCKTITYRCYYDKYPVKCTTKKPWDYPRKPIGNYHFSDISRNREDSVDKIKKYCHRYELWNCGNNKKLLCGVVFLEYTDRNIEKECYKIRDSEKYSYECDTFELKCKKEYYRKMKYHPYKSLECICHIKILEPVSIKRSICRNNHSIITRVTAIWNIFFSRWRWCAFCCDSRGGIFWYYWIDRWIGHKRKRNKGRIGLIYKYGLLLYEYTLWYREFLTEE